MTKILLVEDDAMIASGITYALEMEGYEATCVTNIRDALTAIQRMTFDLAILDMQLPDGTGFDVSDQLKGTATAVIFLTVVDDENSIVKAFEDGAFDYVVKALEYRLLLIFATNKGVLLSRSQILDKIWDIDGNFVEDNTLTVYVKRLREKLGDAITIETVRGMGYRVD